MASASLIGECFALIVIPKANMEKILLILSVEHQRSQTIERAVEIAHERGAELLVLMVVDNHWANTVMRMLSEDMDGVPAEKLSSTILRLYSVRGLEKLHEAEARAQHTGVAFREIVREGDFVEAVLDVIREEQPSLAIATRRPQSRFSRLFFGSVLSQVEKADLCPLMVLDDTENS